jgi:hypothetical protein
VELVTWKVGDPGLQYVIRSHFVSRYRSTAIIITLILEGGFICPHRTLDEYVAKFTGFRPTDGKRWTDSPSPPEPVSPSEPASSKSTSFEPPFPPDFKVESKVSKLDFDDMSMSSVS